MLDTKRLLDQFLGQQAAGLPAQPPAQGQAAGGGQEAGGGLVENAKGFLGANLGGIGGGLAAGGLAGLLLGSKKGRKIAGSAVKYGGMAALGALAYRAYQNYQSGSAPETPQAQAQTPEPVAMLPAPAGSPFNPQDEAAQQSLAQNIMRAMIAAAKADGHVDANEQATIFAHMDQLDLSTEEKAFVLEELRRPLDVDAVASGARTPEEAAEIYTASLLAIDIDSPAERGYLAMLAARLKLDEKLVEHLHATVASATEVPQDDLGQATAPGQKAAAST